MPMLTARLPAQTLYRSALMRGSDQRRGTVPSGSVARSASRGGALVDPFRQIEVDARKFDPDYMREIVPEMAVAVGLALRGVEA